MTDDRIEFLHRQGAPSLAMRRAPGAGPTALWMCGFRSDMEGQKAARLHAESAAAGQAFVRFDYSGCGASQGRFEDGTIGRWREDALAVIDAATEGPLILVGSSMGGWLALLCALARPERVKGLVLIAPAPDFTERLLRPSLPVDAREALRRDGVWMRPTEYGPDPYPITAALIEEGRRWLLLDGPIAFAGPVRILHGQADADVPWTLSQTLCERLASADVEVTLVKSGDHRLSAPADLDRLAQVVRALRERPDTR